LDWKLENELEKKYSSLEYNKEQKEWLENKLGIKTAGRGLHGFRQSYADRLFNSGFEIAEIQEAMRHRTIDTTIKHYKSFNKSKLTNKLNEKLK